MLIRIASFVLACALGVGLASFSSAHSWFHHECPRFDGINPSERFFTLAEGKEKLGRSVHYAHPAPFPQNHGRVAYLDMIVSNKFFIVIYWDAPPHGGKPDLRWYSRDDYERDIVEE